MDRKLRQADTVDIERFWSLLHGPATVSIETGERFGALLEAGADTDLMLIPARTPTGEVVLVSVSRRAFIAGVGAGAATMAAGPALSSKPLAAVFDSSDIDHIRFFHTKRMAIIESDNIYGSACTLPEVLTAITRMQSLRQAKVVDSQAVLRLLAMYAETAAWQYQDQRLFDQAQYWAEKALTWSHQVGDSYYIGLALVRMSQLASDRGDGASSGELAEAAERTAPRSSLFTAAAVAYRAHALALEGDRSASDRAYDLARTLVDRADTDPVWGAFLDHSYIDVYQAHSLTIIGDHNTAIAQFNDATARMQAGYPRDRGVYLARSAVAHMIAGHIEPAAVLGTQALRIGIATGSGRIMDAGEYPGGHDGRYRHPDRRRRVHRRVRAMEGSPVPRPYVVLSVAVSVDGYIDDTIPERLHLSSKADFDRVDQVRSECDAILIGAETLRRDNPRLIIKSEERLTARAALGKPAHLQKVVVTASGNLDPDANFWHHGVEERKPIAYTTDAGAENLRQQLGELATVAPLGAAVDFGALLDDLGGRGIGRLMIEGGTSVHTAVLAAGLADELHVAVAPLLVGQADAPRFVNPAEFPGGTRRRMRLVDVTKVGDVALLRYFPKNDSNDSRP